MLAGDLKVLLIEYEFREYPKCQGNLLIHMLAYKYSSKINVTTDAPRTKL